LSAERLVLEGRFRLLRHLGGGGMSEVYLAEQLSLGRRVALKVLKRDLGRQPAMAERFRREAQLLSTVDHPSVVRVIDFAHGRDGTVLVLELAEGMTLEQALSDGPFSPKRALRVLLQLAEGLEAIHQKGIVHRDIKPHNVVLTLGDRGEQARLLDFGIARLMEIPDDGSGPKFDALSQADPLVSLPGQAVGTPAYVAPEQALAKSVDARTDVYAFGVLAFRVLAGQLPFRGPSVRDFLHQHVEVRAPSLAQVAPELASWPGLVNLVKQCLEKKPEARPADGQALVQALKTLIPPDVDLATQTRQAIGALTSQTWTSVQVRAGVLGKKGVAGAKRAVGLASRLDSRWRKALAGALAVIALVGGAAWAWPPTPTEEATRHLDESRPAEALAVVEKHLPTAGGEAPALLGLKVAALHHLGKDAELRKLLREMPYQALFMAHPHTVAALAERFGEAEADSEWHEWLGLMPRRFTVQTFDRFARQPPSPAQWGSLRWLDVSGQVAPLSLVQRYEAALTSRSCVTRRVASTRLGELGDDDAIAALRELSESPKDDGPQGPVSCGQDEAAEAIRRLKKKK
jgi:hypothetical protein